jgi:hypothetical protein
MSDGLVNQVRLSQRTKRFHYGRRAAVASVSA